MEERGGQEIKKDVNICNLSNPFLEKKQKFGITVQDQKSSSKGGGRGGEGGTGKEERMEGG